MTYELYTDGAYSPLRDTGGVGVVFVKDGEKVYEFSKQIVKTTNNRCELSAMIYALHAISKPVDTIVVYSDSQYVIGTITKDWKRKKNTDLWSIYDRMYEKASKFCSDIRFEWVKGHADNMFNNLADRLATAASQEVN